MIETEQCAYTDSTMIGTEQYAYTNGKVLKGFQMHMVNGERQYIPPVGAAVQFRPAFTPNHTRFPSDGITCINWYRAISVDLEEQSVTVVAAPMPQDPSRDEYIPVTTHLHLVIPPLGWQPQYTIDVVAKDLQNVLGWFSRGIVVRPNHHNLEGSLCFHSADHCEQPSPLFPEIIDAVPPSHCGKVFRVMTTATEPIKLFHPQCVFCKGTGRRALKELAKTRNISLPELRELIPNTIPVDGYDPQTDTYECGCHWGRLDRMGWFAKRNLLKKWARDGWSVRRERLAWNRCRQVVVRDWE